MAGSQMRVNGKSYSPDLSTDPFMNGFNITITGNSTFEISAGCARDFSSPATIAYPSTSANTPASLTVDVRTVGPLGTYPWSVDNFPLSGANYKPCPVYIISAPDSTSLPVTAIVSLSPDINVADAEQNLILPPGYTAWRRIGTIYLQFESLPDNPILRPMVQKDFGKVREYVFAQRIRVLTVTEGTNTAVNLTNSPCPIDPKVTTDVLITRTLTPVAVTDYCATTPTDVGTNTTRFPFEMSVPAQAAGGKVSDSAWIPVSKDVNGDIFVYQTVIGTGSSVEFEVHGIRESHTLVVS